MKCLVSKHIHFIWVAQSYFCYQRNHSIVHGGKRDTLSEAVVSLRTVVTFVTWLISRRVFSNLEIVPERHFWLTSVLRGSDSERKSSR